MKLREILMQRTSIWWIIYSGFHFPRAKKIQPAPAQNQTLVSGSTGGYYTTLHVAVKAGIYGKTVEIYYIPR